MFPIDHFLYTVSYKPILSVIQGRNRKLFKGATKLKFYGFLNHQSLTPSETPRGHMAYELQFKKFHFRFLYFCYLFLRTPKIFLWIGLRNTNSLLQTFFPNRDSISSIAFPQTVWKLFPKDTSTVIMLMFLPIPNRKNVTANLFI